VAGRADPRLTQLFVRLPNHYHLGGNRYAIDTVPLCAYGLNFGDVVEATVEPPEVVAEIRCLLIPSGHRTIRLVFADCVSDRKREVLRRFNRLAVAFEKGEGTEDFFALDIAPGVDMGKVLRTLDRWQFREWIAYELGDARVIGSFGDHPPERLH
jgi:hypothetical protein